MCSQSDDPTQYDTPTFTKPRTYVLAGDAPKTCAAKTANGRRCGRTLGTRNSSAELCGWHELARRREALHAPAAQRGSVALAVIGEMLEEADRWIVSRSRPGTLADMMVRESVLREARDRIAKAEAAQ